MNKPHACEISIGIDINLRSVDKTKIFSDKYANKKNIKLFFYINRIYH